MNSVSPSDVQAFLRSYLDDKLKARGQAWPCELTEDCDLMQKGLLDSLGLLELTVAVAEHFGQDVDFEAIDPNEMTVVGPLAKYISEQINRS